MAQWCHLPEILCNLGFSREATMRSIFTAAVTGFTVLSLSGFGGESSRTVELRVKSPATAQIESLYLRRSARATACVAAPETLFSTTDAKGRVLLCIEQSGKYKAGQLKNDCFKTKQQIAKELAKKARTNSRFRSKADKAKKTAKAEDKLCTSAANGGAPGGGTGGGDDGTVTPTPTATPSGSPGGGGGGGSGGGSNPTPTPTRTPTPTPTSNPLSCFDAAHQNTKAGCFSIPQGVTGNVSAGSSIWNNGSGGVSSCKGCHASEYLNRSYTQLSAVLPASPMFINASTQQKADLTAYLNRFKQ